MDIEEGKVYRKVEPDMYFKDEVIYFMFTREEFPQYAGRLKGKWIIRFPLGEPSWAGKPKFYLYNASLKRYDLLRDAYPTEKIMEEFKKVMKENKESE